MKINDVIFVREKRTNPTIQTKKKDLYMKASQRMGENIILWMERWNGNGIMTKMWSTKCSNVCKGCKRMFFFLLRLFCKSNMKSRSNSGQNTTTQIRWQWWVYFSNEHIFILTNSTDTQYHILTGTINGTSSHILSFVHLLIFLYSSSERVIFCCHLFFSIRFFFMVCFVKVGHLSDGFKFNGVCPMEHS